MPCTGASASRPPAPSPTEPRHRSPRRPGRAECIRPTESHRRRARRFVPCESRRRHLPAPVERGRTGVPLGDHSTARGVVGVRLVAARGVRADGAGRVRRRSPLRPGAGARRHGTRRRRGVRCGDVGVVGPAVRRRAAPARAGGRSLGAYRGDDRDRTLRAAVRRLGARVSSGARPDRPGDRSHRTRRRRHQRGRPRVVVGGAHAGRRRVPRVRERCDAPRPLVPDAAGTAAGPTAGTRPHADVVVADRGGAAARPRPA